MNQKAQSLHVTLPGVLKKFVEQQVKTVGYSTKSDYIQSLVRREMQQKEEERLEKMLLEGLASGEKEYSGESWKRLRKKALA